MIPSSPLLMSSNSADQLSQPPPGPSPSGNGNEWMNSAVQRRPQPPPPLPLLQSPSQRHHVPRINPTSGQRSHTTVEGERQLEMDHDWEAPRWNHSLDDGDIDGGMRDHLGMRDELGSMRNTTTG